MIRRAIRSVGTRYSARRRGRDRSSRNFTSPPPNVRCRRPHILKQRLRPAAATNCAWSKFPALTTRKRFSFILSEKYSTLAIGSDKFVATLACDISQAPGGAGRLSFTLDKKAQRILNIQPSCHPPLFPGGGPQLLLARKLPTRPLDPPSRSAHFAKPVCQSFRTRLTRAWGGVLDVWPLQLGSSSQYPLNMQYNATHPLLCSALRSLLRSTTV